MSKIYDISILIKAYSEVKSKFVKVEKDALLSMLYEIQNLKNKIEKREEETKPLYTPFPGYVDRHEAEKITGRKRTWLHQQIKAGNLQVKKYGNQNYYKITQLKNLLK